MRGLISCLISMISNKGFLLCCIWGLIRCHCLDTRACMSFIHDVLSDLDQY